ncbi:DNA-binding protein WhiA [Petrotoga mexicana]|nr:DNA-binding protein WhiA [Petrotoga mexicana]
MRSMNSFSEALKLSLVNSDYIFPEAEFYGFFIGKGEIIEKETKKLIKISITSLNSFKRLYKLCKYFFTDKFEVQFNNEKRLNLGGTGSIFLNYQTTDKILKKKNICLTKNRFSPLLKKDPVIFGSFIKGLLLSCGSISVKESYHLEFNLKTNNIFKEDLVRTFKSLLGVNARFFNRSKGSKVYIKSRDDILNILELLNAKEKVKELSELMDIRDLRSNVTRTINLISANSSKTAHSSIKQINDIQIIQESIGLDSLPNDLKQIAAFRLENEDASLSNMAESLSMKKSTLYNKLKKISKIAESLKNT